MRLALVSGLSDKKLEQKLRPLQVLDEVIEIHLYRRRPYHGNKIHWVPVPRWACESRVAGDLVRFFRLLMKSRSYDVLIGCNQSYHGLMAFVCGKIWKKPVIQIVITDVKWIYKRHLLRFALLSADACAVRGPISYEMLLGLGYNNRIDVLQNPYDLPSIKTRSKIESRQFDLIAVGDYAKKKEYPWMMEVLSLVKEGWPGLRVAIVGGGAFRQRLGSTLKKQGLDKSIDFLGRKDDKGLERIYLGSKALLLTSSAEGLPMVVLEAMSYGLPVFVTNVGELPWLVRDNKEGRIAAYGDTRAMSDAILHALRNPDTLERMGQDAHARVTSLSPRFGAENIAETWRGLLDAAQN